MKLSEHEGEFIAEMEVEPGGPNEWAHFDPPFLRRAYDRFVRKGWLEYRGDGPDREYRWTAAGRQALASSGGRTMSDARDVIVEAIPGTNAKLCYGLADAIINRLDAAGYRILGPDEVGALDRLMARADAWPLNSDSARVSVRLGDLRAIGRKV